MTKTLIDFLTRRHLAAAAPAIAGCLLLTGCGGSSHGSSANHPSAGGAVNTGSALSVTLVKAMAAYQPNLKNVKVSCPSGPIAYPVTCHFTAISLLPIKGKRVKLPSSGTVRVTGINGTNLKYTVTFA